MYLHNFHSLSPRTKVKANYVEVKTNSAMTNAVIIRSKTSSVNQYCRMLVNIITDLEREPARDSLACLAIHSKEVNRNKALYVSK